MSKEIIKRVEDLLFSNTLSIIGFLTNLGLVTLTYVIVYILKDISYLDNLSSLGWLNIFSISYLALLGISYKWIMGKDKRFNAGFVIATIFMSLIIFSTYFRILF